jgi:hypothetical protein
MRTQITSGLVCNQYAPEHLYPETQHIIYLKIQFPWIKGMVFQRCKNLLLANLS